MLTDQATEDARRGGKSTSCRTGLSLNETRELLDPGRENMNVPPIPAQCAQTARIATEIATLGFALPGTLTEPMTRCGHPGCRCHADPPRLHGPYHQRTRKKDGKPSPASSPAASRRLPARARTPSSCSRGSPFHVFIDCCTTG